MPQVAVAVGAAVAASAGASLATAIGLGSLGGTILGAIGSAVVGSVLSKAFAPDEPDIGGAKISSQGLTRQIRQPIVEHKIIYGEARVGGAITFMEVSSDTKYLHIITTLAGHECEAINEVWFDDYAITDDMMDGSGNVTEGRYDGYVRIKKHLGATDQTADSDLVSETSADSTYRGRGIAYIYVRLKYDRKVFFGGVPNISAVVQGKKLYDPREDDTIYSSNSVLFIRDYLKNEKYGYGAKDYAIDDDNISSGANIADEFIDTEGKDFEVASVDATDDWIELEDELLFTQRGDRVRAIGTIPAGLSSGVDYYVIPYQQKGNDVYNARIKLATSLENALAGTTVNITGTGSSFTVRKIAEARYHGGGVIDTKHSLKPNIENMLSSQAGRLTRVGQQLYVLPGAYRTPAVSYDENDIVGGVVVDAKVSRTDRFNTVKGVYRSPINNDQPSDYPTVTNSTYVTQDNGEQIIKEIDQNFTQKPHQAQRIAKIELERVRQEIAVSCPVTLKAMQTKAGDVIEFSFDAYGFSNNKFEVVSWNLDLQNMQINMELRETASGVYDWNSGEETAVDLAPNTNLPNAFTVPIVAGFSLDSVLVETQSGDKTFKVVASWDISENEYVASGGNYEIEFKKTTDSVYSSAAKVDGTVTEQQITGLQPDITYDIRIIAYNNFGVPSAPSEISGFTVGSTITTNVEDWENETLSRDGDDWENDTLGDEDWET